jgi:hypothetical protein
MTGQTATIPDCEWGYIGEGYDPAEAAELCADGKGNSSDEETEKPGKDHAWEYWYG